MRTITKGILFKRENKLL